MRDAHVGIVRQPFSWARIETAPGRLDFSVYDRVMAAAASRGPRGPAGHHGPAAVAQHGAGPGACARCTRRATRRRWRRSRRRSSGATGPAGRFWAAHPELDAGRRSAAGRSGTSRTSRPSGRPGPIRPRTSRLLDAVGAAIHAVDPDAEIVAGGLPYAGTGSRRTEFLDAMYAAGARGTFDTIAVHPYAADPRRRAGGPAPRAPQLDRLGDPERPIWATEFGWATGGPPVTITDDRARAGGAAARRDRRDAAGARRAAPARLRRVSLAGRGAERRPDRRLGAAHGPAARRRHAEAGARGVRATAPTIWRVEPTAAQTATAAAELKRAAAERRAPPPCRRRRRRAAACCASARYVSRGRLVVAVDVPPGGGSGRVRIAYAAHPRRARRRSRASRRVSTRRRVARAVFRLSPTVRRSRDAARHREPRRRARHPPPSLEHPTPTGVVALSGQPLDPSTQLPHKSRASLRWQAGR